MLAIVNLLILPLVLLNSLGGVVAFIWLAVLGKWSVIGYGVLYVIGMPILFAIAQLPSLGFTAVGAWLADRNWRTGFLLCVFLGALWTSALIVIWCSTIVFKYVDLSSEVSAIPILLWGYTVAVGPLAYMASKDGDNPFTGIQMLIAQVFVLALGISLLVAASPPVLLGLMLLALLAYPLLALALGGAALAMSRAA